ncbi:hypothetical protein [Pseudomonas marginalis]|uniref:hypothetical protein n=1 Tax=Pseudomonas marginalis TaxID=298 RepID=UPI003B9F2D0A
MMQFKKNAVGYLRSTRKHQCSSCHVGGQINQTIWRITAPKQGFNSCALSGKIKRLLHVTRERVQQKRLCQVVLEQIPTVNGTYYRATEFNS